MSSQSTPLAVFCVSAPEDEVWLRKLETHLSILKQQGLISLWHDQLLSPGAHSSQEIHAHLEAASIILFLVSADFFASDFFVGHEMERALARHAANEVRLLPILVRPAEWKESPLGHLRVLPAGARPLSSWPDHDQALADVATEIRRMIVTDSSHQPLHEKPPVPGRWVRPEGPLWVLSALVSTGLFVFTFGAIWFLISLSPISHPWSSVLTVVSFLLFGLISLAINPFSRLFFASLFKNHPPSDPVRTNFSPPSPLPQVSSSAPEEEIRLEIIDVPVRKEPAALYQPIFLFNERLLDSKEFFGRKQERITLLARASRGASTSIVGPRRIGKTWLVEYLRHVASDQLGSEYRVGYLNATMPRCDTVSGFTRAALESLGVRVWPKQATLHLKVLEDAVQLLREQHFSPILCIDEFEGLNDQAEFDLPFFKGLRAISNAGLALVTASKGTLLSIVGDNGKTSGFFNIFEACLLKPFDEEEAREFVQVKGNQAEFGEQERKLLFKYGQRGEQQWYPLRLQLAGKMLLEDQNAGKCRPDELDYQSSFTTELEKKYRAVVVEG